MTRDVFATAALRRAVAEAWLGSATRFREDANTEEDHARGYYRGRVVVELLQNAADAAARAGVPGDVRLTLDGHLLRVTNTGAPLDADGVASLASLRASAKPASDGQVGRFGVGFAAVRSVSDAVTVRSRTGGVRFSLEATRAELAALAASPDQQRLARDVAARGDDLPVLRMPFEAAPLPTDASYDTVVELVLRDEAAILAVKDQLEQIDDVLLLAFPAIARCTYEIDTPRTVRRRNLRTYSAEGRFEESDVAELPREQRRLGWSLTWALVPDADPSAPRVLHAPTPTDVRVDLPAVLVATFPVDAGRRGVLAGAATDRLAAEAGRAYAGLVAGAAEPLDMVPTGLPASDVDTAIRTAALDALRTAPLLTAPATDPDSSSVRAGDDAAGRVAPVDALIVAGAPGDDPDLVRALATMLPGVVQVAPRHQATARALGATVVSLADLVDDLPPGLPAHRWRTLLEALGPHASEPGLLESLAGARVPLADGRTAGVRGAVVLPEDTHDDGDEASLVATARALGLRVVHPDAAHPLLLRAGATATDPQHLLRDPEVRRVGLEAAEAALDGDAEAWEVTDSVLALVRMAPETEAPFWVGEMPVPTTGGPRALRESTLPGSWAADVLSELDPVTDAAVARYCGKVLEAAGVRTGPGVYTVPDAVTPDEDDDDGAAGPDDPAGWLARWADYLRFLGARFGPGVSLGDLVAVADLDAVGDETWAEVLPRLAGEPETRRALLTPVRSGRRAAPSYTAWWLRDRFGAPFALHDGVPLLPPTPAVMHDLDDATRRSLGAVAVLADLEATDWPRALDRLPAVGRPMPLRDALVVWRGLAHLATRLDPADRADALDPLPERLPALDASAVVVHAADDVEVAGTARWAALGAVLPAPQSEASALADLLDLPLAGQDGLPAPDSSGDERALDPRVAVLDHRMPACWYEHDRLSVAGRPVPWWVDSAGRVHATSVAGLAAGLADLLGRPDRVALLTAVLAEPERALALWATTAWG